MKVLSFFLQMSMLESCGICFFTQAAHQKHIRSPSKTFDLGRANRVIEVAAPTAAWYSFGLQLMECAMRDFVFEFEMFQGWWSDEWKKILTLGIYESQTQKPQFFLPPLAWFTDVFTGCVYRCLQMFSH